jgi:hypothetical protein
MRRTLVIVPASVRQSAQEHAWRPVYTNIAEGIPGLPRLDGCAYILPNPTTKKPYRTLTQSWDVAKTKSALLQLELEDLRYCRLDQTVWREQLQDLLQQSESQESVAS